MIPIWLLFQACLPLQAWVGTPAPGSTDAETKEWLQKNVINPQLSGEMTLATAAGRLGSERDRTTYGWFNIVILSPELSGKKIRLEWNEQSAWDLLQELVEKAGAQVVISGNVVEIHPKGEKIVVPALEGEAQARMDSATIPFLKWKDTSLASAVDGLNGFVYNAKNTTQTERQETFPKEPRMAPVVLDPALDSRVTVPDLKLWTISVATAVRYLAVTAGLNVKVDGKSVLLLPGNDSVLREGTFRDEVTDFLQRQDGESMMQSLRQGRLTEQIRTMRSDPRDWEKEMAEWIREDHHLITKIYDVIEVRRSWGKPVVMEAMQERVTGRMEILLRNGATMPAGEVESRQESLRNACLDLLRGDRPENFTYLLERLRGGDGFITAINGAGLEDLHRKEIEGLKAEKSDHIPEALRQNILEERRVLIKGLEEKVPEPKSMEGDRFLIRLFSALKRFGGDGHLAALREIEKQMKEAGRSASLEAAVRTAVRTIEERAAKGELPETPQEPALTEPRMLGGGGGPGKISLPDALVIEKESWGDEGSHSGVILDRKSGLRLHFSSNNSGGFLGYHPKDIEWSSALYFERSPEGWYDAQYLVGDNGKELRVVATYGFQRCRFVATLPRGSDYRPALELLKSIKVEMAEGWQIIRGEKFDEFQVRPIR